MDLDLLANIAWHTLTGAHARFATGDGAVRRYARGFSPIVGVADPDRPDFDAMRRLCDPGEHIYCGGMPVALPAAWRVDAETTMHQFVWDAAPPDEVAGIQAVPLQPAHVARMLDLVGRTRPGPFGPRTIELGDYLGVFEGDTLLAMAGERMTAGRLREISGVCTDPAAQGRGLARALMQRLMRRSIARGETPFLHVRTDNPAALQLYERMGFRRVGTRRLCVVTRID